MIQGTMKKYKIGMIDFYLTLVKGMLSDLLHRLLVVHLNTMDMLFHLCSH